MEEILKGLIAEYGWAVAGWAVAGLILVRSFLDSRADRISSKEIIALMNAYHSAIVDNTKVTERLALLIEERTRQQNGRH